MNTQRTMNLSRTLGEMQSTINDIKTSLEELEEKLKTLYDRETDADTSGALPTMDERIQYLDFTSLYPSINRAVQYPVGGTRAQYGR